MIPLTLVKKNNSIKALAFSKSIEVKFKIHEMFI